MSPDPSHSSHFSNPKTVLIDQSHKRWIIVTLLIGAAALGLHAWLYFSTPGGLTGGSAAGLWFGIVGSLMMIFAGLLAIHRKLPRAAWMGIRSFWLKGHIWIGLLSLVFIVCHSSYRWGGPVEFALWLAFLFTLLTGIYGLALQQVLPNLMARRVPNEAPFEQIPHICMMMRQKADELVDSFCRPQKGKNKKANVDSTLLVENVRPQFLEFYEEQVRPMLYPKFSRRMPLGRKIQAEVLFARIRQLPGFQAVAEPLGFLEELCEERRQLADQERIYWWLHSWLYLHVPLSIMLLVLGAAHVVMALYY